MRGFSACVINLTAMLEFEHCRSNVPCFQVLSDEHQRQLYDLSNNQRASASARAAAASATAAGPPKASRHSRRGHPAASEAARQVLDRGHPAHSGWDLRWLGKDFGLPPVVR